MHIERGRFPLDGHIPEELITKIKGTQDIVEVISRHVSLKKSGQNYSGLCPFHSEKTPSFVVSPAKQLFHCFGCGTGGNVITFLMKYENVTFPEVLKNLARDAGIAIPSKSVKSERKEESLYEVNRLIAEYYNKILLTYKEAGAAREYLLGRGLSTEVIERFNVGYSINSWNNVYEYLRNKGFKDEVLVKTGLVIPKNSGAGFYDRFRGRIMFPIYDTQGRVVGFGGRVLDDSTPKYLNSPETPLFNKGALLYGLNIAKDGVRESGYAIIVEGYMDVIAVCQSGIPNVAGTLGTALTVNHLRVLNRFCKEVILTFDPDIAGRNAALRTVDIFIESGIRGKVLILPEGEDPDIFIRKRGKGQFLELIERSKGIFDFSLDHIIGKSGDRPDKGSIEKKVSVTEECFEL
ncbi:MAG TPA: DNA primase, partial [Nitrospiraceae bacterium]|nr:DNA primase [Nitrospiraceae bacterium]